MAPLPDDADDHGRVFPPSTVGAGPLYLTGDDRIRFETMYWAQPATVEITGRLVLLDGRVVPFSQSYKPSNDRLPRSVMFSVGAGWLLSVTARCTDQLPSLGQMFGTIIVVRGIGSQFVETATLAAGYFGSPHRLAWPGSQVRTIADGPTVQRVYSASTPAAGAEFSETVPGSSRWSVRSVIATLTCSATVANRQPVLVFDDGIVELYRSSIAVNETASGAWVNTWASGVGHGGAGVGFHCFASLPSPPHTLLAGSRIRSLTSGLQVDDQWTVIRFLVDERIEGLAAPAGG